MKPAWTAALLCALALACPPALAHAARCAPIAGGSQALAAIEAEARLGFIQQRMQEGARRARLWSWGWGSGYALLAAGNLAAVGFTDHESAVDHYVSTVSSAFGVATFLIAPLKVMRDHRRLERLIAGAGGGGDRCLLLAQAEHLLLADAASEARGKSTLVRVGSVMYNVMVAMVLGFGFNRWSTAGLNLVVGATISQIMSITQPVDEVEALEQYRAGRLAPAAGRRARAPAWALSPLLGSGRYGAGLGLSF